jgi:hypothetical protein
MLSWRSDLKSLVLECFIHAIFSIYTTKKEEFQIEQCKND